MDPTQTEHRGPGRPPKSEKPATSPEQMADNIRLMERLRRYYDEARAQYAPIQKRMQLLDATDSGDLWKSIKARFPAYQIMPDTNFVSYVKNNLLASIYCVGKSASIQPTSEHDKDIIVNLNIAMERIWTMSKVPYYQFLAGDRAALLNMGITQVGWTENAAQQYGSDIQKGNIVLRNVDPLKFMRDPFATSLETSAYCLTTENYPKTFFMEDTRYREAFRQYLFTHQEGSTIPIVTNINKQQPTPPQRGYYTLVTFWVRENGSINEYHTLNAEYLLYSKQGIRPNTFPFAILYCNEPAGKLIGNSECSKIFANNVAYNIMNSLAITAEYKNQRPPKFVNKMSGLNIRAFSKTGDDADKTFLVNRDADKAVYYHQFPPVSMNINNIMLGLQNGIEAMSGIDSHYTGRNTGSILTTGGMEQMLNRVTVIDTPKIMQYENYARQLTSLILYNFVEFAGSRKYFYKDPNKFEWKTVTVNFKEIDADTLFDYTIDISSELPRNKQHIADVANNLMEKQMQYEQEGHSVDLITEEEWLMFQDLPNKEYMLKRMGIQRMEDQVTNVSQTLFTYANLVKNGMSPDDAIMATAQYLEKQRQGEANPQPDAATDFQTQAMPQQTSQAAAQAVPGV